MKMPKVMMTGMIMHATQDGIDISVDCRSLWRAMATTMMMIMMIMMTMVMIMMIMMIMTMIMMMMIMTMLTMMTNMTMI